MQQRFFAGLLAATLASGAGMAWAQQPQPQQQPQQQRQPIDHQEERAKQQGEQPGKVDGKESNSAGRTPEKGQAIGLAPSDARTDGEAVAAVPGAGGQTMPSTQSPDNAAKDAHWWLDRGQDFTTEQKQAIYSLLARDGAQAGAGTKIFAEPSAVVSPDAKLHEIPKELSAQIPSTGEFKYVVEQNKVLLIDPVNGVVSAVIEK